MVIENSYMDEEDFMRNKEQSKVLGRSGSSSTDSRIRRASYYVWFLGAEECRGLRGPEVVRPVLQYLLDREKEHEPEKVTLQVSGRGIKLLQQGVTSRAAAAGSTKHFIPCGAITHVQQEETPDDDIVSAVLLIYNPLTRCPVHVHAYRCDSTETASVLRHHLQQLLQRPEQQAKLTALETRLTSRGLLPSSSSRTSDGASSGSSVSSGAGSASGRVPSGEKIATLYDSLAAELREKLGTRAGPLLLPPKDYDRAGRRRKKHKIPSGVDQYGSSISRKTHEDDSARSSGIGSDEAPSPTQEKEFGGCGGLENQSSSDEEWVGHESSDIKGDAGLMLVQSPWRGSSTPSRHTPTRPHQKERGRKHHSPTRHYPLSPQRNLSPLRITPIRKGSRRAKDRSSSPGSPQDRFHDAREKFLSLERQRSAIEASTGEYFPHPDGVGRSTSWEVTSRGYPSQGHRGREKRRVFGSREDILWPKSDRDTGYGSRDALLRDRRAREAKEGDYWRKEGVKTPDIWDYKGHERGQSPTRGRPRTPVKDHRMPRIRSPDRQEYLRAKSMHDLSQRRKVVEDEKRSRDPRRRSLYDQTAEEISQQDKRQFSSHSHLVAPSSGSSSSSSPSRGPRYHELPENQRFPGLDRSTARADPLESRSKKTFDYPVNGGHAPIHITRAHHDDYRKYRYDHGNAQYIRPAQVSAVHY